MIRELRESLIKKFYEKSEPFLFLTEKEFSESFKDWTMICHPDKEDPAFVAFVKGPEFHFVSMERRVPLSLKTIKDFLRVIIKHKGYALTRTPHEDKRQQRFNELIGFQKISEDEYDIHYRIEKI